MYIYIYVCLFVCLFVGLCLCVCICVYIFLFFVFLKREESKYLKMNGSAKRFMYLMNCLLNSSCMYVSNLLLSSEENIYNI